MKGIVHTIRVRLWLLSLFITAGTAFAGKYCLQNSEGLSCIYKDELDCESQRQDHELCVLNPKLFSSDEEKLHLITPASIFEHLCYGSFCYKYSQEVCNEEEIKVDSPLRCRQDY